MLPRRSAQFRNVEQGSATQPDNLFVYVRGGVRVCVCVYVYVYVHVCDETKIRRSREQAVDSRTSTKTQ